MSEIKRINTRAELEQKREHFIQCLATQDKQILICGGTGCVAGGSLKIYDRLKELMEERDIACTVQLEGGAPRPQHRPEKKRLPRLLRNGPPSADRAHGMALY